MKLLSVFTPGGSRLAVKLDRGILVVAELNGLEAANGESFPSSLQEIIYLEDGVATLQKRLEGAVTRPEVQELLRPESEFRISRPFLPSNIICVGLNYKDHAEESNIALPTQPILFAKWTGAASGPDDPIVLPPDTKEVDYEAELAVIIGRPCRGVSEAEALHYVAGYACMNDVSARDFQRGDGQWVRAKSQDTFGPFGPYLVTSDEIPDPQSLPIRCSVNGRLLQNSNTDKMIFSVRELIAFISRGVTLRPGDLITTGTPNGVGFAQKPPVFLQAGDTVSVEIDGIGCLSNSVQAM